MPTTTKFIWDDQNYLAEADGADTINIVYTYEPQHHGNLISTRLSGTASYYHQLDALGSTKQLVSAAGNVKDAFLYDAWGNTLSRTGNTATALLWNGAVGYYDDANTGFISVRRRSYGAQGGRWTSSDPHRFADGLNCYQYSGNAPVLLADPSGMTIEFKTDSFTSGPYTATGVTWSKLINALADVSFTWNLSFSIKAQPAQATQLWMVFRARAFGRRPPDCELGYGDYSVCDILKLRAIKQVPLGTISFPDTQGATLNIKPCTYRYTVDALIGFDDFEDPPVQERLNDGSPSCGGDLPRLSNPQGPVLRFRWTYTYWNRDQCCKCVPGFVLPGPNKVRENLDTPWFFAEDEDSSVI